MPRHLALLLCFVALTAGCAGHASDQTGQRAPVMTLSDFYGFCSALPEPGGCFSDPVCQRFRQELAAAPRDLMSCLAMCRSTERALYTDNLVNGCGVILERAEDLCDQFCRRRDTR